jgi:hypothetical protein
MNVPSLSDTDNAELAALKLASVIKNKPPTAVGSVPVKVKVKGTELFVLNKPPGFPTNKPPTALAEIEWPKKETSNGLA